MTSASLLGWCFALVAAATSAWFAATLTSDPILRAVLVSLSVLAVVFERSALVLRRRARERNDGSAMMMASCLLLVACLYTAGMQLGFFASVMLGPLSIQKGATAQIDMLKAEIHEHELRRGWLERPAGTSESLAQLVAELEKSRDRSPAGIAALRKARTDLAAARAIDEVDSKLNQLRGRFAELSARPPADPKAAALEGLSFGHIDGAWAPYAAVVLSVILLQLAQTWIPIVAGEKPRTNAGAPADQPPSAPAATAALQITADKPKKTAKKKAPEPEDVPWPDLPQAKGGGAGGVSAPRAGLRGYLRAVN